MADLGSYWQDLAQGRLSRRRLLRTGAIAGLGAAALGLIGCGGGSEGGDDPSGLLTRPVDTSNRAKKGGMLPLDGGLLSFNFLRSATENNQTSWAYSRLLRFETVKFPETPQPNVVADAATSWETSPDGLTYTFKVRPNFKWDPRPPTSGRSMTAQDIKFAWDWWAKSAVARSALVNEADPNGPVVSATAPDSSTFVLKLAFPYAPLTPLLAFYKYFQIVPPEAESQYDYLNDMRGTGALRLKEWTIEAKNVWEKNPDWYDSDKVYLDGVTYFELPEYTARLSQFRAGNIATTLVSQDDILSTKRDLPDLQMMPEQYFDRTPTWIRFGYLPDSPFRDERVRRAMSMMIDRDLVVNTLNNVQAFRDVGLDVPTAWHSCIGAGEVWWLDPQDQKAFGPNARWYQYDPAEAKKLAIAAGLEKGFDLPFTPSAGSSEPGSYDYKLVEILIGMFGADNIFRFNFNHPGTTANFRSGWHYNYNRHVGLALGGGGADYPDIDGNLQVNYKSGQDRTGHVDADGKPDAYLDDIIAKQRSETDLEKRKALLHDFQRHFAGKMYGLYEPADSLGFDLAHAWLGNWRAFAAMPDMGSLWNEAGVHYWIDESKKA